jgi:hypothetical protein
MPIQVICPSCKTGFRVSDQFAGKEGPCPKCKAKIRIPKAEPAKAGATAPAAPQAAPGDTAATAKKPVPPPVEVKIHEPETMGPKTSTGRPVVKPLTRRETRFQWLPALMIGGGTLLAFAISWLLRKPLQASLPARGAGLLVVSWPLVIGGYWFLRNDELEAYRGKALWLRAAICALVYMLLWGGYHYLPADMASAVYNWILIAPPFLLVGAGAAFATLDLEVESAFFHYCFYVLVTLALGFVAGLPMPWQAPPRTRPAAPPRPPTLPATTGPATTGRLPVSEPRQAPLRPSSAGRFGHRIEIVAGSDRIVGRADLHFRIGVEMVGSLLLIADRPRVEHLIAQLPLANAAAAGARQHGGEQQPI